MIRPSIFRLLIGTLALLSSGVHAQTLSNAASVSLLTVAPGEELYSVFGHSALRVSDPSNGFDRCYNYGTFDFDQPNFYVNFCRGKLLYVLDLEKYRSFEYGYRREGRAVVEQVLRLDSTQRQTLFNLLETNALPENRSYKYDFFYDNCATRIRDIVKKSLDNRVAFDASQFAPGTTMRQLLHPYLKNQPWTRFGIDLILGQPTDKKADVEDFMFLPDHMRALFASAKVGDAPLIGDERPIVSFGTQASAAAPGFLARPIFAMSLIALIGFATLLFPRGARIFDPLFWFAIGAAGLLMALLWFATDHGATKTNWNLLWALPTHLLVFWRRGDTLFLRRYFACTAGLALIAVLAWKWLPQALPIEALPLALLVLAKGALRAGWLQRARA